MTQATNTIEGEILLAGDLFGNDANAPSLVSTGVTPLATPTTVGKMHVDSKGRITWQGKGDYVTDIMPIAPLASKTEKGVVEIGNNIDVASGLISVAQGSATTRGVVQVGSGLTVNDGLISVDLAGIPNATDVTLGKVIVGSGLNVTADGTLSFLGAADATTSTKGIVQAGAGIDFSNGTISVKTASTVDKGLFKISSPLLAQAGKAWIRKATTITMGHLGGVVAGNGFNIDGNNVLSFDVNALPIATDSVGGVVRVGSGFAISPDGTLSISTAADATTSTKGTIQVGDGFTVSGGIMSLAEASQTQKGAVQVSTTNGLTITSGDLNISKAEGSTTFGTVKSGNVNNITIVDGAIDIGPNIMKLNTMNVYTKAVVPLFASFTNISGALAPNLTTPNMSEYILSGNLTLNAPVNIVPGMVASFMITQDATGGRTLTLNSSVYKTNQTITLSTAPNATDILTMICKDSNNVFLLFSAGY